MKKYTLLFVIFVSISFAFSEGNKEFEITTKIKNNKKAKVFDKEYNIMFPCHDYFSLFNFITPGLFDSVSKENHDISYILTNTIKGETVEKIDILKQNIEKSAKTILTEIWMQPLNHSTEGYMYLDNFKVITKPYNGKNTKEIIIGKDINSNFDRHCMINQGDTLYYYSVANYDKRIKLFGQDTLVIDFDFYEWNKQRNTTTFLFSASDLVNDSMLVPELFKSDGIYNNVLDVYHWNWIQKVDGNKLLLNFAYSGFLQYDLVTKKTDWYWCNNSSSFNSIKRKGSKSNPYYTHHLNQISTGPFKGYYSYFENGAIGDSAIPFKPALARIFKINSQKNTLEIVFEKKYDVATIAMGSIDVAGNYVLVNLGMTTPVAGIMKNVEEYDINTAVEYFKNYKHPQVYLYDLKGKEISNYVYPFGFYSYIAWLKKKN